MKLLEKKCKSCGKTFLTYLVNMEYCSVDCREKGEGLTDEWKDMKEDRCKGTPGKVMASLLLDQRIIYQQERESAIKNWVGYSKPEAEKPKSEENKKARPTRKKQELEDRECDCCGKEYSPTKSWQRFCLECGEKIRLERNLRSQESFRRQNGMPVRVYKTERPPKDPMIAAFFEKEDRKARKKKTGKQGKRNRFRFSDR